MPRKRLPPLTDIEVHERLCAAAEAIGDASGVTIRGNTALETARRALVMLQLALVQAMEDRTDKLTGVKDQD
ncbi:hypothetical protein V5F41_02990 [Xanthobacter autotrophicus]|uniref:hypothetical protein n=1 Tax=Xanthobacter autotrophicus TaxID=280 RepID=UPI00372B840A